MFNRLMRGAVIAAAVTSLAAAATVAAAVVVTDPAEAKSAKSRSAAKVRPASAAAQKFSARDFFDNISRNGF
jgi:hypothetical protein